MKKLKLLSAISSALGYEEASDIIKESMFLAFPYVVNPEKEKPKQSVDELVSLWKDLKNKKSSGNGE